MPPDEPRFYLMFIKATVVGLAGVGLLLVGAVWALYALMIGQPRAALPPALCAALGVSLLFYCVWRIKAVRRAEIDWHRARGQEPPRARSAPPA